MTTEDPYVRKKFAVNAYASKNDLHGTVVAVLRGTLQDRNLGLIPQPSRVVLRGDIHELIATDEEAAPGSNVGRVAYVAFVEFHNGGVLVRGDQVVIGGQVVGHLAGFDLSHAPNHMNVVVGGSLVSGEERGLQVGMEVLFRMVD
ncbi:MAG TPA: hypothetical protein GXX23_09650 [Firmicutes bacterium]|nr:hypothetical protein [Candidatus Fermentithermobacillaceae bacterium]